MCTQTYAYLIIGIDSQAWGRKGKKGPVVNIRGRYLQIHLALLSLAGASYSECKISPFIVFTSRLKIFTFHQGGQYVGKVNTRGAKIQCVSTYITVNLHKYHHYHRHHQCRLHPCPRFQQDLVQSQNFPAGLICPHAHDKKHARIHIAPVTCCSCRRQLLGWQRGREGGGEEERRRRRRTQKNPSKVGCLGGPDGK